MARARRRRAAERSGGVAGAVLTVNHGAHFGMVDAPAEERHANGDGDGPEREDDHHDVRPARPRPAAPAPPECGDRGDACD